jgi:hypothetical protein
MNPFLTSCWLMFITGDGPAGERAKRGELLASHVVEPMSGPESFKNRERIHIFRR